MLNTEKKINMLRSGSQNLSFYFLLGKQFDPSSGSYSDKHLFRQNKVSVKLLFITFCYSLLLCCLNLCWLCAVLKECKYNKIVTTHFTKQTIQSHHSPQSFTQQLPVKIIKIRILNFWIKAPLWKEKKTHSKAQGILCQLARSRVWEVFRGCFFCPWWSFSAGHKWLGVSSIQVVECGLLLMSHPLATLDSLPEIQEIMLTQCTTFHYDSSLLLYIVTANAFPPKGSV